MGGTFLFSLFTTKTRRHEAARRGPSVAAPQATELRHPLGEGEGDREGGREVGRGELPTDVRLGWEGVCAQVVWLSGDASISPGSSGGPDKTGHFRTLWLWEAWAGGWDAVVGELVMMLPVLAAGTLGEAGWRSTVDGLGGRRESESLYRKGVCCVFWCKTTQHEGCVNLEVVDWQGVKNSQNPRGIIRVMF